MLGAVDAQQVQSPKYLTILAVAACLILGLGWLLRPREVQKAPAPLPTENELAQLTRRAERRSLDGMTAYFAGTADETDASLVLLPDVPASGVAWNARTIVTAPVRRQDTGALTVQWPFGEARQQLTAWGPGLPLATVTATGLSGLTTARVAASAPDPGGWVLAVWRTSQDRRFAPGSYLQSVPATCGRTPVLEVLSSLALNASMSGGGLFDADGGLLAVILPCGDRFAAVAAESVNTILKESATDEQRVLARFGLVFATLTEDTRAYFTADRGAFVREVWTGHRGDEAGLLPGDVVLELNDTEVTSAQDLAARLSGLTDQEIALGIRRGSTTLTVKLLTRDTAAVAQPDEKASGVVWGATTGYRMDAILPGSRAATAGLEPGDRLMRINHAETASLAQVRRTLTRESGPPLLLDVEREDRRLALLWPGRTK